MLTHPSSSDAPGFAGPLLPRFRLTGPFLLGDKCAGMNVFRCCGCLCCLAGDLSGLLKAASTEIAPT
jgi:hypothetical protein